MFGFFSKKKKDNQETNSAPSTGVSNEVSKSASSGSGKVILQKSQDALERNVISLKKEKGVDLTKHKARVFVDLDISGSMHSLFENGSVQKTLTRLLPLALRFDDNGELEVNVFNHNSYKMEPMTIRNYENYVKKEIVKKGYAPNGGTSYAPVIRENVKDYNDGNSNPAFGIFITDGENNDAFETDQEIRNSSNYKIFFQFVGIGNENFIYLKKLDELSGRKADNTAFIKVADFDKLSDDDLYKKLLDQYPEWLKAMGIN